RLQGGGLPEVAPQTYDLDARIADGQRLQRRERAVAAAVIDEHDLIGLKATTQSGADALMQPWDVLLLVLDRYHDLQIHHAPLHLPYAAQLPPWDKRQRDIRARPAN